ncbi:MAG: DUF4212 domain-containing protein [Cyanobacteria bacterium SID2]|nr:DUF4212 domain-containing protein [Cyanobacteria bacterium SID2]MBP0004414.1 DUF4212 domain-containing protein [Cyanobacteria bacterium SBC]
MEPERYRGYWKANISLVRNLLIVWGVVSIVFGILLVEPLNALSFGKIPLGFWIAQQGSVLVFVILIFVYAVLMDKVDKKYGLRD